VSDHRLLGRLVQALLDHVDDQRTSTFRFNADEQGDKSVRRRSAVLPEPSQRLLDAHAECRVGGQPSTGGRAAIG
jgi:hypothetical protein